MDGILTIHKATGMTSHDVVARVRKLLQQKRVGHAGTLDPLASGVLPICVGQATRVAEYLSESGKAYQAEITFGVETDTYDAEGTVTSTTDTSSLTLAQIEDALPHFLGPQQQLPPRYSAIKLQGQPAYKRARSGQAFTLEPRQVEIYQLQIEHWQLSVLTLTIACSKGTYIRSFAHDLGAFLGYGAHLTALIRTRSGPFSLAQSITLEQLKAAIIQGNLADHVFPADSVLQDYPALYLDLSTAEQVLHGNPFTYPELSAQPIPRLTRIYDAKGRFLAIATWDAQRQQWHPEKVFAPS